MPIPVYDPLSSPVFNPLPQAGASSTVAQSQSQSRTKDSGYQRSGQSANPQKPNSSSNTCTIGSTRGGR
jgi:hypothetical protein